MTKKFIDKLEDWVSTGKTKHNRQDKNVVAFLAIRDDVIEAISAGYSKKTIWLYMSDNKKISYQYETFLRHVRRFIDNRPLKKAPTQDTNPGFKFDSEANEKDLV